MAESAPSQNSTVLPEEIAQQWARTRLAHEAVMLQDAAETLKLDRARTQAHQREFLGPAWSDPQGGEVIHIGDSYQALPAQAAASPLPVAQPVQPSSIGGTLAKLGIGAALVATGAGLAPGWSLIASAMKDRLTVQQPATTTAQPQTPPNFYGLELVPPK